MALRRYDLRLAHRVLFLLCEYGARGTTSVGDPSGRGRLGVACGLTLGGVRGHALEVVGVTVRTAINRGWHAFGDINKGALQRASFFLDVFGGRDDNSIVAGDDLLCSRTGGDVGASGNHVAGFAFGALK